MYTLAEQQGWNDESNWAFDGRKNVYTSSMFLPQHEEKLPVRPDFSASSSV